MLKKGSTAAVTCIASAMLLSGCGLFQTDQAKTEIDPPQNVTYVKEDKNEKQTAKESKEEKQADTVMRELYLIDKDGYVVSQSIPLPKSEGTARQTLEYLVDGGPISDLLPNGFRAVLPADTSVSVDIKDGTAVVDFSNEFKNYKKEDEQRILQSVTWTLTQFDSISKVKLKMNGHDLKEMPVNGTPISEDLSREDGINIQHEAVTDMTATQPVTVYYLSQSDDTTYYVPVTKRTSKEEDDPITAAIDQLVSGPSKTSNLLTDFDQDVKLVSAPKIKDGHVTLDFNESIFGSADEKKKVISQKVLDSIVLTLTEQPNVKSVSVKVNGKAELVNEKGTELTKPVSRPDRVNTGSF
ncbi:GerMN domain-containing protein [Bacillus sp. NPDC077027]|uniref:GerMN domain-containing protein n=1 Tax=Bacillus sp. NPDC077027 TaxID=3390548 RepID=UPI003CFD2F75